MIIGITEHGDPSIDYAWVNKMALVDGAILITKNLTDKFMDEILKVKEKVILHASCTGYGGTVVEPNLPSYQKQLDNVRELIRRGFPQKQIVVRIDPIIPTEKGTQLVRSVVEYIQADIKRFRVSVIDMYPHVAKRFTDANLPLPFEKFQATEEQFSALNKELDTLQKEYGVVFESCAEIFLNAVKQTGCVGKDDIQLLGLELDETADSLKGQRPGCLCCSAKSEMLQGLKCDNYGCAYRCLYCYWK